MTLRERVQELADELAEPVFRAAVYLGEYDQGQRAGEDAERIFVSTRLYQILQENP